MGAADVFPAYSGTHGLKVGHCLLAGSGSGGWDDDGDDDDGDGDDDAELRHRPGLKSLGVTATALPPFPASIPCLFMDRCPPNP